MAMHDPPHPGEIIRDAVRAEGWTVAEAAARLGVTRNTLSRVLNGRAGVSPRMALALERIGWSDAGALGAYAGRLRFGPGARFGSLKTFLTVLTEMQGRTAP